MFNIQALIIDWASEFIDIFQSFSPSNLQLPKLHAWCYHLVPAIKEYGAINALTTETYETLHKDYVKKPYQRTNKKEYMSQIVRTVSTM